MAVIDADILFYAMLNLHNIIAQSRHPDCGVGNDPTVIFVCFDQQQSPIVGTSEWLEPSQGNARAAATTLTSINCQGLDWEKLQQEWEGPTRIYWAAAMQPAKSILGCSDCFGVHI